MGHPSRLLSPRRPVRFRSPPKPTYAYAAASNVGPMSEHAGPRWARRLALTLTAIAAVVLAATLGGIGDRDRAATFLGFGIEQVSLTGHRFTQDSDLFAALQLETARSLLSFDAAATGRRFEQLPWVQSAQISRIWPGQLAVHVTERTPFAIWELGDSASLIDASGRVLGPVKRDAVLGLPHFSGEGAATGAAALMTTLGRHPGIKSLVKRADRVGARRWTLVLDGGGKIHLPADGEATALAKLTSDTQLMALVSVPGQIIDVRSPNRIAVRAASRPAGAGHNGAGHNGGGP